ncbi:MAG TPA: hypothetical protein VMH38_08190 [Thermoplasmata archaeon]|nr:hypothetical protein [Thermoplasmata archaeon]
MTKIVAVLLSLPVVAVLLGALSLCLVYLGRSWGFGLYTLLLLIVPIALAVGYLAWYRTLPYEPSQRRMTPAPHPAAAPEEPFEDPVEEADRLDQGKGAEGTEVPAEDADVPSGNPPDTN